MSADSILRFASCKHGVDNSNHSTTPFPEHPTIHIESLTINNPANCLPCTVRIALENTRMIVDLYDGKIEATIIDLSGRGSVESARPWWTIKFLQSQKEDREAGSRKNAEICSVWRGVGRSWSRATRASGAANSFNGRAGAQEILAGMRLITEDGILLGAALQWRARIGDSVGAVVGEEEILLRRGG